MLLCYVANNYILNLHTNMFTITNSNHHNDAVAAADDYSYY